MQKKMSWFRNELKRVIKREKCLLLWWKAFFDRIILEINCWCLPQTRVGEDTQRNYIFVSIERIVWIDKNVSRILFHTITKKLMFSSDWNRFHAKYLQMQWTFSLIIITSLQTLKITVALARQPQQHWLNIERQLFVSLNNALNVSRILGFVHKNDNNFIATLPFGHYLSQLRWLLALFYRKADTIGNQWAIDQSFQLEAINTAFKQTFIAFLTKLLLLNRNVIQ